MVDKGKEILAVRNAASNEYGGINVTGSFKPSGLFPPALQK